MGVRIMDQEVEGTEFEKGEASFEEREKSLQDSLKKYQRMVNEVEDGVVEADLKGNITFVNKAVCRNYG